MSEGGAGDAADVLPLFWDELPEDAEDNAQYAALQAIRAESTPLEQAEAHKEHGNASLRIGLTAKKKFYLRRARDEYSKALQAIAGLTSPEGLRMRALVHSNRAQTSLLLGNNREALTEATIALRLDPGLVKAYYRASKAALELDELVTAADMATAGLRLDPNANELSRLLAKANDQQAKRRMPQHASTLQLHRIQNNLLITQEPAAQLAAVIALRGWRVGYPQLSVGAAGRAYLDAERRVHWPVTLVYPEVMQRDAVEDWCEDTPFAAQLVAMFGPDAPPLQWDAARAYCLDSVELYYMANASKPLPHDQVHQVLTGRWAGSSMAGKDASPYAPQRYGKRATGWVRVQPGWTLAQALARPDFVVPGQPVFFALAKNTAFRTSFLRDDIPLL